MIEEENNVNLLKEIFVLIWDKKKIIITITILFIILGGIYTFLVRNESYTATSSIMFSRVAGYIPQEGESQLLSEIQFNSSIIGNYKNFITSDEVLKTVIENLNIKDTLGDFKEKIKLESDGSNIDVIVNYEDEELAEKIANDILNVFVQKSKEFYQIDHTYTINYASESTSTNNVNHALDLLFFTVLGAFASCSVVYIKFLFNPTIIIENNIENKLKLPIITTLNLNEYKNIIENDDKFEQFNILRTNVELSNENRIPKTILISTPDSSSYKDYISANLGLAFSKIGKKVLVVDMDKDNGNLHKFFDYDNSYGIYNYFSNNNKDKLIYHTKYKNLDVISKGNIIDGKTIVIQKDKVNKFIETMEKDYDIIIVSGPEFLKYADSRILANICDETLLAISMKKTKESELVESAKEIKKSQGNLLGVIINKF